MKFGKLADIGSVDFSLPSIPEGTTRLLESLAQTERPKIFVGCTGWSMKEWLGRVYPKGTKSKDYLRHYAKQFNTIELNTTHYRIPDAATIQKWYEESTDDFRFCPKIPQAISHSRDLGLGDGKITAFCEAVQGLSEKMGCCFMQLSPYFDQSRLSLLETFLERFPKQIPLAVEVRHESWFATPQAFEPLARILEKHQIATVITDVAGRRDVLHQRLTNDTAMIRFVGNGLHATDYERVDAWVAQLKNWLDQGLKKVYFFPHEPDNLLAPEMAEYLVQQIRQQIAIELRGPNLILEDDGKQFSLF